MTTKTTPFGPLENILQDPAVTEIMVDGLSRITIERKGKLEDTGLTFESETTLRTTINAVLAMGGAAFAPGQTVCETRLSDNSRVMAVLPPTSLSGPCLVIRKMFKTGMTLERLIEYKAVSPEMIDLLRGAIHARLNIVLGGGTGSGKTTLLNTLTGEIPAGERVITVEEFAELDPRFAHVVRLASEQVPGMTFIDLINTAAKMRPDRLIYGEMRGPEALRMLQIMSFGHDGSMVTLHADAAEDALARVEAFCLMANLGLGLSEIRNLIASTLRLVVILRKLPGGNRKVTEIVEVCGLDSDRYILQPLMRYNAETDQFESTSVKPSWEKH